MKKIFLLICFCCCAFWSEAQNYCSVLTSPNISPLLAMPGPTPGTAVLSMPNMVPVADTRFNWFKSVDNGLTFSEMPGRVSDTLIVSTNTYALYYCRRSTGTNYTASSSSSLNLSIPDNSATGVSNSLRINGQGSINSNTPINVTLNITHPYTGDLNAYLVGPNNCGALELSTGNGSGSDGMNLTLHTTGSFPNITTTNIFASGLITGDYLTELGVTIAPVTSRIPITVVPLVSLTGQPTSLPACPINGFWKLFIADLTSQVAGRLNSWSLNISNILSLVPLDSSGIIQIEPSNSTPSFNIRPFVRGAAPIGKSLISFKAVGAEDSLVYNSTDFVVPVYPASSATNTFDEDIFNVTFGSINNSSVCGALAPGPGSLSSMYSNYTTSVAAPTLSPGQSVSYSVQAGSCNDNNTYDNQIGIYIDYNRDGDFADANEIIFEEPNPTNGPHTIIGTTIIPLNALQGATVMRVVNLESSDPLSASGNYQWGETEDYLICISTPSPSNPYHGYSNLTSFDTCSTNASDSVALNISRYINDPQVEIFNDFISKVLIDWNKDGFFDDNTEKILDTITTHDNLSVINYTFKVPNGTPKGNYKMRIASSNLTIAPCNNSSQYNNLHQLFTPYSFITNTASNNNRDAEFQDFTLNINASAKITDYRNIRCNGNYSTDTIFFHYEGPAITADSISLYNVNAISGLLSPPTSYVSTTGDGYFSNFPPGTYYISINLPSGTNFINTDNVSISQPTAITGGTVESAYVSCNGGSDGVISLSTVSGGTPFVTQPYTYSWTGPNSFTANTSYITGLSAGDYTCTITDANGCNKTVSHTIIQPDPLVVSEIHAPVKCNNGTSDSVRIIVTGGTGSYSYDWGSGYVLYDSIHRNLPYNIAGYVQVKDENGCTGNVIYSFINPPVINIATTVTNLSCYRNASGKIVSTVTGGASPYQYQWFNSTGPISGATRDSLVNIAAGNYYVKVTDALGCIRSTLNITVTQPDSLILTTNITPVTCFGGSNGSITGTAANGTAPYQFEWSNSSTVTNGSNSTINNLTAGQYFVYLTDSRACRQQFQVIVGTPPQMLINGTVVNPTCSFNCDGSITLNNTITNASVPVTYLWNNGSTSQNISSLCVGKDTVTIRDSRGCTEKKGFELLASAAERVNLGPDKILCANQSYYGNVTISNPANNSPYVWTGPNGYTSNTPVVYINQTGVYYVQVKDNNGCVGKDTISVTATNGVIAAEFIAPTQAFKGGKVTLLNISSPAPNSIEWQIPTTNLITTLSQTPLKCELVFRDTGKFTIKMKATRGDCDSTFAKTINVIDSTEFGTPSDYILDPLVKRFTVGPNPNSGNFSVQLNLLSNSKIKLRLINILTNQTVNTREETVLKNQDYSFSYNVSVPAGVYILVLETPVTTRIIKVVIN